MFLKKGLILMCRLPDPVKPRVCSAVSNERSGTRRGGLRGGGGGERGLTGEFINYAVNTDASPVAPTKSQHLPFKITAYEPFPAPINKI